MAELRVKEKMTGNENTNAPSPAGAVLNRIELSESLKEVHRALNKAEADRRGAELEGKQRMAELKDLLINFVDDVAELSDSKGYDLLVSKYEEHLFKWRDLDSETKLNFIAGLGSRWKPEHWQSFSFKFFLVNRENDRKVVRCYLEFDENKEANISESLMYRDSSWSQPHDIEMEAWIHAICDPDKIQERLKEYEAKWERFQMQTMALTELEKLGEILVDYAALGTDSLTKQAK